MKLPVVNTTGKEVGTITVSDKVWAVPVNKALLAQAVHVYRSNQRQTTAVVKARHDVHGSRRKIWRQKGTGRARHGDRMAPIFVGGGVAHGPTGREVYRKSLNRKMRQAALFMTLADRVKHKRLAVVDRFPKGLTKTRELEAVLGKLVSGGRALMVIDEPSQELMRAARNLDGVEVARPQQLNALSVLSCRSLVMSKAAMNKLEEHFIKS